MKKEIMPYKVSIFGDHYMLMSDEGASAVEALAQKVDLLMQEIATKMGTKDGRRVAVLAAVKLMHQLSELENNLQQKDREESQLIHYINQQLSSLSS
jgi:cell division protein ZapA (FtsZ GTPase activity inhibitor)